MSETGLSVIGERQCGADVRAANVTAVAALANILKSSLGPQGLDKMLVDDIGDVTITNDGATILKQLEVEHPAAKVLVELAHLQDTEVGDGTTSVVIIAAELLKRANELVKNQIHPTTIMSGYRIAMKESIKWIQKEMAVQVDALDQDVLHQVAKTSLSSKFVGAESQLFSQIIVDAMKAVKVKGQDGKMKYPVGQVNVLKSHGQSASESMLVPSGYAMQLGRTSQEMPTSVTPAKIALIDFDLKKHRMGQGVNIVIDDPEELEKVRQKEMDITKEKIKKIVAAGTNALFTTKGIDDMAMKYLVEAGVYALRRVNKQDMRRIAKCTGGQILLTMATLEGDEAFDEKSLGLADEVCEQRVGDNDFTFIKGCSQSKAATILLRGANEFMLEEADRSVHDALCAVSRTLESNSVVPGGGAVEVALSLHLEDHARTFDSYEQWAISEFAEALLTIPKTLASNAALDGIDLLATLRVRHYASQQNPQDAKKKDYKWYGLDLINNTVRNSVQAGVVEPMVSKLKSLKFATEAAITILRIDDLVKIAPEPEPQG
jgi:T-complex protein 1 subunit alpha